MEKAIVSKSKVFHESKTGLRTFCLFTSITSHCEWDYDASFAELLLQYYSKDVYLDDEILKITIPKLVEPHNAAIKQQLNGMFEHRDDVVYEAFIIELKSKDDINRCRQLNIKFVGVYDLDDKMEVLFKPQSIIFNDAVLSCCYSYIQLYNKYVNQILH
jgi:hypothetical protein